MKIAFVGKGGSGKTSHTALFLTWLSGQGMPVLAIDADINMHLPPFFGIDPKQLVHLSRPKEAQLLKSWLRGENHRIANLAAFRKTTPPGRGSRLVTWADCANGPLKSLFCSVAPQLIVGAVGTYEEEHIGASCYHNSLSVFENFLSHYHDETSVVVTDMVAGTDAFASSLHAQFDLLVLQVEPTRRGLEVYDQFVTLTESAGIRKQLCVVANKVDTDTQRSFVRDHIAEEDFLGFLPTLSTLQTYDLTGEPLTASAVGEVYAPLGSEILKQLRLRRMSPELRLQKLHELHRKYVSQEFVRRAHGDLTSQIDPQFHFA